MADIRNKPYLLLTFTRDVYCRCLICLRNRRFQRAAIDHRRTKHSHKTVARAMSADQFHFFCRQ